MVSHLQPTLLLYKCPLHLSYEHRGREPILIHLRPANALLPHPDTHTPTSPTNPPSPPPRRTPLPNKPPTPNPPPQPPRLAPRRSTPLLHSWRVHLRLARRLRGMASVRRRRRVGRYCRSVSGRLGGRDPYGLGLGSGVAGVAVYGCLGRCDGLGGWTGVDGRVGVRGGREDRFE
jgi:hypothetical protein